MDENIRFGSNYIKVWWFDLVRFIFALFELYICSENTGIEAIICTFREHGLYFTIYNISKNITFEVPIRSDLEQYLVLIVCIMLIIALDNPLARSFSIKNASHEQQRCFYYFFLSPLYLSGKASFV